LDEGQIHSGVAQEDGEALDEALVYDACLVDAQTESPGSGKNGPSPD
jgi:hypothetical protein